MAAARADDRRAAGAALALASSASSQTGAAVGALAFAAVGVPGVVAVRQVVAAVALNAVVRWSPRSLGRRTWVLVAVLAAVMGLMNLTIYGAVDRIGLGLAVTIEFLGPLGVAVATSRRLLDVLAAAAAAVGVLVLVAPGPSSDLLGIALALTAAGAWAAYILLSRAVAERVPGVQGAAAAATVLAAAWALPVLVVTLLARPPVAALGLAAACGVLSSALPYAVDLAALRRLPASVFSTLASANPVWAFLAGALVLGEGVAAHELVGAALVVVANLVATAVPRRGRRPAGTVPAGLPAGGHPALPAEVPADAPAEVSGRDGAA
ncbi:EamA family transporter [Quadrisphaera sp. KR29]|uniref:EamA family transporter n=1 Tax=Quadrisphaera sp. KR29 TaxID=3461391 RepID=UPI0040440E27